MTIFTDAGTIRSVTTPKVTAETKQSVDTGTIRSKATVVGVDHYCIYIPVFTFNADLDYVMLDNFNRFSTTSKSKYSYFAELNPQANPC